MCDAFRSLFAYWIKIVLFSALLPSVLAKVIDIRLPYVKVPPQETYYVCQQFEIDDTRPYHVTTFEAVINNTDIVHHVLLFGCEFKLDEEGPHPCDTIDYRCRTWLVKWDMGMDKIIRMPENSGVRIGKGEFKYIMLQIHWNNVGARGDRTDSSGMRLYTTETLRRYDIGNVQIGQYHIDIPAESDSVLVSGGCSGTCTGLMLPKPIYLTEIYLHMHELGIRGAVDILQDREVSERIVHEENYNYTQPVWHSLRPPVVLYPGQPIKMMCWYNSKDGPRQRNVTVNYGQGSSAEMCYAFIRYYPRIVGFDQCLEEKDKDMNC